MSDDAKFLLDKIQGEINQDFQLVRNDEEIYKLFRRRNFVADLMRYKPIRWMFAKRFFKSPVKIVEEILTYPPKPLRNIVREWRKCASSDDREMIWIMARIRIRRYYHLGNDHNPYIPMHNRAYAEKVTDDIVRIVDKFLFPTSIDKNEQKA